MRRAHHFSPEGIIGKPTKNRVNNQIRISPVRLIDADGEQVGVVPIDEAREAAEEAGLDLVEVAPRARPPVCRVMDWGKHLYQQQKAAKEAKKRQHTVELKEVKLRPATEEHDLMTKLRHAKRFLKKGNKVKVTIRYRGRELRRPELGYELLDRIKKELADLCSIDSRSKRIENRQLHMVMSPATD